MKDTLQHELDRVQSMTDDQLWTRYGKMNKENKIEAFLDALVQENRNEGLQRQISLDLGIQFGRLHVDSSDSSEDSEMEFVRVLVNEDKENYTEKKALFVYSDNYFLYSYVNNEYAHETMVFPCDSDGVNFDAHEIASDSGYAPSAEIMEKVLHSIRESM